MCAGWVRRIEGKSVEVCAARGSKLSQDGKRQSQGSVGASALVAVRRHGEHRASQIRIGREADVQVISPKAPAQTSVLPEASRCAPEMKNE